MGLNKDVIRQALQVCLTFADLKDAHELEIPIGAFESELAVAREVRDVLLREAIAELLLDEMS